MPVVDQWVGCYGASWKGLCHPAAFAHPAKFSRALIQRLYAHACAEGWLQAGETVLDPFAGVSLGGLPAGLRGLQHVGIELEPRFHALALENVALWQRKYGALAQWVAPVCLQGDSRQLDALVARHIGCCLSSPPYAHLCSNDNQRTIHTQGLHPGHNEGDGHTYGTTPGQLEGMPLGSLDAAISSPPFGNTDTKPTALGIGHATRSNGDGAGRNKGDSASPQRAGNLGAMPVEPDITAVVSSPPYANGCTHTGGADPHPEYIEGGELSHVAYGQSDGQLANQETSTFWAAAHVILTQTYAVLQPGGVAMWVLKSFVRHGQIVDFPGQWRTLCEHMGFVTLHEHHAMQVDSPSAQGLFGEDVAYYRVSHKSFFRRDNERKGSPPVDFETVYCMQKPGTHDARDHEPSTEGA